MLRASLVIVLALVATLAACGGEDKQGTPATQTPSTDTRDIGAEVLGAVVAAAADNDAEGVWELLSKPSQRRAGGSLEEFERSAFPGLRRKLAPFARGELPVQVSGNLDGKFGIVALSRGRNAYAAPLRKEGDVWRLELPGPVSIDVLGPPPNSRGQFVQQIGIERHGQSGPGVAVLYLDGVTLDPKTFSGPKSATIYANFASPLKRGRHTVVAFTSAGDNAAARAWTFFP